MSAIKKILFICKHNRFRSKVAEHLFNKLNKKKGYEAFSRGLKFDGDVADKVVKALRKQNIKRVDRKSRLLKKEDVKNADIVIIVADNVKRKISKNQKVWKISDTSQSDYKGIVERTEKIKKRIKKLISMLK